MKIIYIIIIVLIVFIINIIYINRASILYMTNFFNKNYNKEGLPLAYSIRDEIIKFINNITDVKSFTFIDFGCGAGDMINEVYQLVGNVDGVEYHIPQAELTKNRFKNIDNVTIYPMNMMDYEFKQTNTILYLYEPLWQMENNIALEIYSKVFENLIKNKMKIYVIYCSAIKQKYLNMDFFSKYDLKLIKMKTISRGIPFMNNNLYFLET